MNQFCCFQNLPLERSEGGDSPSTTPLEVQQLKTYAHEDFVQPALKIIIFALLVCDDQPCHVSIELIALIKINFVEDEDYGKVNCAQELSESPAVRIQNQPDGLPHDEIPPLNHLYVSFKPSLSHL